MGRLEKIAAMVKERGFDAVMLTGQENLQYATTFPHLEGFAIITADGRGFCYTDSRYIESATAVMEPLGYKVVQPEGSYPTFKTPQEVIDECGVRVLAFEDLLMPVHDYNMYREALSALLVPVGNAFEIMREVKDEQEIECLVKAQRIAESSLFEILPKIKAGAYEDELAAELSYIMQKKGSEGGSFGMIFISGTKTSMPHGKPSHKVIEEGDFVTIDFGAKCGGYGSDMTRTFAVGYATDEMKKVYEVVLKAQESAIAATKAGVPGKEIDAVARKVITDAGYGENFGHGYGHSLGLEIHEAPNTNTSNPEPMPVGAVCSAEPGIYLPGKFGVRIEDVVIIKEDGCEDITKSPKHLIVV